MTDILDDPSICEKAEDLKNYTFSLHHMMSKVNSTTNYDEKVTIYLNGNIDLLRACIAGFELGQSLNMDDLSKVLDNKTLNEDELSNAKKLWIEIRNKNTKTLISNLQSVIANLEKTLI